AMNSQYSTAHKSVPYKTVFGQPPHCDTNLVNLFENNYSYPQTEKSNSSSDSLISETDSQSTIVSELNNDVKSSKIDPFCFEETRQDNSDVNSNVDEEINSNADEVNGNVDKKVNSNADEEVNSDASINFNSDTDEEMYSNMDEDEVQEMNNDMDEAQEMNIQNNFQDYSEVRITSNEIIIIDDSDNDS
ncbi:5319_t:CDS:2, partial [Racocetra persica]